MSQQTALELIELLKDRLQEAADCMDCGLDIVRDAGLTTADVERQIQDSRYFVKLANGFIKDQAQLVVMNKGEVA
jgi:hypothetical protein